MHSEHGRRHGAERRSGESRHSRRGSSGSRRTSHGTTEDKLLGYLILLILLIVIVVVHEWLVASDTGVPWYEKPELVPPGPGEGP